MARGGGGRIINIASISGVTGAALASAYAASKGAVQPGAGRRLLCALIPPGS